MESKLFVVLFERFNSLVISLRDAAQLSGMSYQTARQMASEGRLPFHSFKVGSLRMVKLSSLVDWIDGIDNSARTQAPAPTSASVPAPQKRGRGRPRKDDGGVK